MDYLRPRNHFGQEILFRYDGENKPSLYVTATSPDEPSAIFVTWITPHAVRKSIVLQREQVLDLYSALEEWLLDTGEEDGSDTD